MVKAAIFGAGATGGTLGALIIKSGGKVDLYARNAAHVSAVRSNGLTLRYPASKTANSAREATKNEREITKTSSETKENNAEEELSFTVPADIFLSEELPSRAEELGEYDIVFLMTKQRENAENVRFLQRYLSPRGILVTTQNGLPEGQIAKLVGANRTFGCVCSFGANFERAGEARLTSTLSSAKICVGAYAPEAADPAVLKDLRALLAPISSFTGDEFYRETDNLAGVRYGKLLLNAAFSGLSAATGMTFGEIAKHKRSQKIALKIMRETLAVAEKNGVVVEKIQNRDLSALLKKRRFLIGIIKDKLLLTLLPLFVKTHKNSVSGMLLDLRRGKRTEIDFITGAVVFEGAAAGVETPCLTAVTSLVHAVEDGLAELSAENLSFFPQ